MNNITLLCYETFVVPSLLSTYAIKSVKQSFSPSQDLLAQMEVFREIVNEAISIGLETEAQLSAETVQLDYQQLRKRHRQSSLPSRYYLNAISKAAGVLASRKKSIKRGIATKDPYLKRSILVSCYNFKITDDGYLQFSIGKRNRIRIPLNKHTLKATSGDGINVRSFTITCYSLSLSIRKEVNEYVPKSFLGIDRNASNVTYGNASRTVQFFLT